MQTTTLLRILIITAIISLCTFFFGLVIYGQEPQSNKLLIVLPLIIWFLCTIAAIDLLIFHEPTAIVKVVHPERFKIRITATQTNGGTFQYKLYAKIFLGTWSVYYASTDFKAIQKAAKELEETNKTNWSSKLSRKPINIM